jgi:hypothetical protein
MIVEEVTRITGATGDEALRLAIAYLAKHKDMSFSDVSKAVEVHRDPLFMHWIEADKSMDYIPAFRTRYKLLIQTL